MREVYGKMLKCLEYTKNPHRKWCGINRRCNFDCDIGGGLLCLPCLPRQRKDGKYVYFKKVAKSDDDGAS